MPSSWRCPSALGAQPGNPRRHPALRDHLAWFVLAAVEEMDLTAFYGAYCGDGWGVRRTTQA